MNNGSVYDLAHVDAEVRKRAERWKLHDKLIDDAIARARAEWAADVAFLTWRDETKRAQT